MKSLLPPNRGLPAPFAALQREIDRLFSNFAQDFSIGGSRHLVPKVDASETDKEVEITVELPGLEEKDVEINVAGNVLTIRGEKKAEEKREDRNYRLLERSYGAFSRSIELPAGVNPDEINAKMAKGVLTVTVPKPPQVQAKKVEIKPAG